MDSMAFTADMNMGMGLDDNTFTWEMIGLGLEEPLPPQETIDELYVPHSSVWNACSCYKSRHQIYFDKIHPSVPMIHKYRYLAAMNLYVTVISSVHLYFFFHFDILRMLPAISSPCLLGRFKIWTIFSTSFSPYFWLRLCINLTFLALLWHTPPLFY